MGDEEIAFLMCFQVVWMLQVWDPHFEKQWSGGEKIKVRREQRVPEEAAK